MLIGKLKALTFIPTRVQDLAAPKLRIHSILRTKYPEYLEESQLDEAAGEGQAEAEVEVEVAKEEEEKREPPPPIVFSNSAETAATARALIYGYGFYELLCRISEFQEDPFYRHVIWRVESMRKEIERLSEEQADAEMKQAIV